jgi:hypothetical protein
VVVIDDSLSSGTSLQKAITALEEEGLEVEGTVALVHFPYRGSKEWANASGYRTVTLYDIWSDLGMAEAHPLHESYAGAGPELGRARTWRGSPKWADNGTVGPGAESTASGRMQRPPVSRGLPFSGGLPNV